MAVIVQDEGGTIPARAGGTSLAMRFCNPAIGPSPRGRGNRRHAMHPA